MCVFCLTVDYVKKTATKMVVSFNTCMKQQCETEVFQNTWQPIILNKPHTTASRFGPATSLYRSINVHMDQNKTNTNKQKEKKKKTKKETCHPGTASCIGIPHCESPHLDHYRYEKRGQLYPNNSDGSKQKINKNKKQKQNRKPAGRVTAVCKGIPHSWPLHHDQYR